MPREAISYHYERNPADPRIQHALTLEVDDYGNVLKQAAIGYGRRTTDPRRRRAGATCSRCPIQASPSSMPPIKPSRPPPLLTYTENRVTNAIESPDTHRNPLPCEALHLRADRLRADRTGRPLPGRGPGRAGSRCAGRLRHEFTDRGRLRGRGHRRPCRRPIEWLRTLYRRDDLSGLLPLGELQSLAPARRELQARLHARAARAGLPAPARRPAGRSPCCPTRRPCSAARPATGAATCRARRSRPTGASRERCRRPLVDSVRAVVLQHRIPPTTPPPSWRRRGSTSSCRAATATPSARTPSSTSTPTTC